MSFEEQIVQHVRHLPEVLQAEVLDFIGYLEAKNARQDAVDWSRLSLAQAMRGMEQEESPYSEADFKERCRLV